MPNNFASRARQRSGDAVLTIAREAIQLHGAIGYTDECDVGLFVDRALVMAARYGRPHAHVARCARIQSTIAPPADEGDDADTMLADHDLPGGGLERASTTTRSDASCAAGTR